MFMNRVLNEMILQVLMNCQMNQFNMQLSSEKNLVHQSKFYPETVLVHIYTTNNKAKKLKDFSGWAATPQILVI